MRLGKAGFWSVAAACLLLWIGGTFLLPLCFPFVVGTGLALAAEPLVKFLCRRLHLPRAVSAGVGVFAAFLSIALLVLLVLAFLVRELGILAGILPDLTQTARSGIILLQNWLMDLAGKTPSGIRPLLQQNVITLFSGGTALLDKAFSYVLGLAGTILGHVPDSALGLGTAVISAFMISARMPRIKTWLTSHISRERLSSAAHTLKHFRRVMGSWISAQIRLAGITFGLLAAGLLFLRIPYGILWAAGISLVDAVPVLGTGTVLLPWGMICFLQGDKARALGILGLYGVITLTRSVMEPKLVGSQLGLDPLITLFALYAGFRLWGVGGMILAPLLAVMLKQLLPESRKK